MLRVLLQGLRGGVATSRYPAAPVELPARFRGAPRPQPDGLFRSLPPDSVCPSGAITRTPDGTQCTIDLGRCIFCGRCAEHDPAGALQLGREFELAACRREELRRTLGSDTDGRLLSLEPQPAEADDLGQRVASRIRAVLGRSLHLRHLDAGSCNACDWELTTLLAPHYDARRLGIDFVASPRHADGVIVTGPVTRNLEFAVRRTFEAAPEPRVVIAVGACACSGGIVGTSYASEGGVDTVLPVDAYVPGCPPRPEAILFGILLLLGRLTPKRT